MSTSKDITYVDFNNKKVTRTFYFNLTAYEILELNLVDELEAVGTSQDMQRILKALKRLIGSAVGERIGDTLEKSESITNRFVASDAFSELALGLLKAEDTEGDMLKFVGAMLPVEFQGDMTKLRESIESRREDSNNTEEN